jgi:hypothetical protein
MTLITSRAGFTLLLLSRRAYRGLIDCYTPCYTWVQKHNGRVRSFS